MYVQYFPSQNPVNYYKKITPLLGKYKKDII